MELKYGYVYNYLLPTKRVKLVAYNSAPTKATLVCCQTTRRCHYKATTLLHAGGREHGGRRAYQAGAAAGHHTGRRAVHHGGALVGDVHTQTQLLPICRSSKRQ